MRARMSCVASAVWRAGPLTSLATTGEALAGFAGARGFDGRVEGEQVGLLGDVLDGLDDAADLVGCRTEVAVTFVARTREVGGGAGDLWRRRSLGDLADARGHLFDGGGDGAHGVRHHVARLADRLHVRGHLSEAAATCDVCACVRSALCARVWGGRRELRRGAAHAVRLCAMVPTVSAAGGRGTLLNHLPISPSSSLRASSRRERRSPSPSAMS